MINTAKDDNNGDDNDDNDYNDDNDDNAAAQRRRGESRATTCRPHLTITVAKATKAQVGIVIIIIIIIIVIIVIIILIKICFQGGGSVPRLLFGLVELSGSAQGSVGPPGGGTQWCSVGPSGT